MKESSKRFQELKNESDKIFQEAITDYRLRNPIIKAKAAMDDTGEEKTFYGFQSPIYKKEKEKEKEGEDAGSVIQKIGTGKYRMGKSIIHGLQGASESEVLNYDWENSTLDWLLDCEFEGILNLDLKKGILQSFGGIWKSGVFKGLTFGNHSSASFGVKGQDSKVEFGDGVIKPRYVPSYATWHVSPMAFVSGTIARETGGIFGKPDAPNGPVTQSFNVLTLAPGKSLKISVSSKLPVRGQGGKMEKAPVSAVHEIRMIKRIDSNNSDVTLEIINGENNKVVKETFPWSEFRKSGEKSLIYNPGQNMGLLNMAGIDLSDKSTSSEVVEGSKGSLISSPQKDAEAEKKLATTQQTFDLKKVPYLNIDKPAPGASGKIEPGMKETEVYFYSPNTDYLNKFNEVSKNIESGVMTSDMDIIASGIRNGVITGYYNYPFLKELFNNVQGGEAAPEGYAVPMKRLNDFYQYFVDRIYSQGDNGKINKPVQDLIKRKVKRALGVDAKIKAQQASGAEEAQPETGGVTPTPKKVEAPVAEGVLISMRKIISENLKHF